jgi:hypothetical protein
MVMIQGQTLADVKPGRIFDAKTGMTNLIAADDTGRPYRRSECWKE